MEDRSAARAAEIDLVKAYAIFGVLLIHVCAAGFSVNETGSPGWNGVLFWGTVSRASVPLFFMCTGALFLRPEKEYPLKKLLLGNIPRVLAALFLWALIYKFYPFLVAGAITPEQAVQAVKEVLLFRHETHLYYLHITLLIYLCVPVLRVFTVHAGRKQLVYALALWFCVGILYPTVKSFWPFKLLQGIPAQYALNMTWASLGYCLLGYCIRTFPLPKKWIYPLLWGTGLAATFGLTLFLSLRAGTLQAKFLEGMSVNVAVMGAGIFGTLCGVKPGPRLSRAVRAVSGASFTVYLSHLLFLYEFSRRFGWDAGKKPSPLFVPLVALSAFACGFALWLLLRKIPGVRRWLT